MGEKGPGKIDRSIQTRSALAADMSSTAGSLLLHQLRKLKLMGSSSVTSVEKLLEHFRPETRQLISNEFARRFGRDKITYDELNALIVRIQEGQMYRAEEVDRLLSIVMEQNVKSSSSGIIGDKPQIFISGMIETPALLDLKDMDKLERLFQFIPPEERLNLAKVLRQKNIDFISEAELDLWIYKIQSVFNPRFIRAFDFVILLREIRKSGQGDIVLRSYRPETFELWAIYEENKNDPTALKTKLASYLKLKYEVLDRMYERFNKPLRPIGERNFFETLSRGLIELSMVPHSFESTDKKLSAALRLGQAYEAHVYTKLEWERFAILYSANDSFRESFISRYLAPVSLSEHRSNNIYATEGKVYFNTWDQLDSLKDKPLDEQACAMQEIIYHSTSESAASAAVVDQGGRIVPVLAKAVENHLVSLDKARTIINELVKKSEEKNDLSVIIELADIYEKTDADQKAPSNGEAAKISFVTSALNLFKTETLISVASNYIKTQNILAARLKNSEPIASGVVRILKSFYMRSISELSSNFKNEKLREALFEYIKQASEELNVKEAQIFLKDVEYRAKLNGSGKIPNLHVLIQSFYLLKIISYFAAYSETESNVLIEAKKAALELYEFIGKQRSKYTDIAYIPAFIVARIGGEHREKAVDEIKNAIKADNSRGGIYIALDVVQNILGAEIYVALGKAYKELKMSEHFPEALIYADIIKETNRLEKVKAVMASIKNNQKLWIGIITLINHEKYEDARQVITMILNQARSLDKEKSFDKTNLDKAIETKFSLIDKFIFEALSRL